MFSILQPSHCLPVLLLYSYSLEPQTHLFQTIFSRALLVAIFVGNKLWLAFHTTPELLRISRSTVTNIQPSRLYQLTAGVDLENFHRSSMCNRSIGTLRTFVVLGILYVSVALDPLLSSTELLHLTALLVRIEISPFQPLKQMFGY